MPAKSKKQQRFMAMIAHTPGMAKARGIPKSVAEEFSHKPKGGYRKRRKLGDSPHLMPRADRHGYY